MDVLSLSSISTSLSLIRDGVDAIHGAEDERNEAISMNDEKHLYRCTRKVSVYLLYI